MPSFTRNVALGGKKTNPETLLPPCLTAFHFLTLIFNEDRKVYNFDSSIYFYHFYLKQYNEQLLQLGFNCSWMNVSIK